MDSSYYLIGIVMICSFILIGYDKYNLPIQNEHVADVSIYQRDSLVHEFKNLPPGGLSLLLEGRSESDRSRH